MWISHHPGRRPAIFRVLARNNARRRRQNGECLIHGNPLLCGLRALQQLGPRGKVPPPLSTFTSGAIRSKAPVDFLLSARQTVTGPFWKQGRNCLSAVHQCLAVHHGRVGSLSAMRASHAHQIGRAASGFRSGKAYFRMPGMRPPADLRIEAEVIPPRNAAATSLLVASIHMRCIMTAKHRTHVSIGHCLP
jgi:hypothetical protein